MLNSIVILQECLDYNEIYGTFLFDTSKIISIHTKKLSKDGKTVWETTVEYTD